MVDRFEDVYEFNLKGNFPEELERLSEGISQAQAEWIGLKNTLANTASFRRTRKELGELAKIGDEAALTTEAQKAKYENLASAATALGQAHVKLVREMNKLNAARVAELETLQQTQRTTGPQVIQTRAEVAALRSLTKQLEAEATKREFRNRAAALGLSVSADGTRLFNLEAEAAERAAAAIERAGVAEKTRSILGAQGLTAQGTKPLSIDGKLTPEGEQAAQVRAQRKLEAALLKDREDGLLRSNKAFLDTTTGAKKFRTQVEEVATTGEKTNSVFGNLFFTFRRLFGVLAVFTVARRVVSGFNELIAGAVKLRAELETTQSGIAGIIASTSDVRDALGNRLTIKDQVLESQRIAADQLQKLNVQALETAGTLETLAPAFEQALGVGLSSGLGIDQIRELTINISQAATSMGLSQRQLGEEIRSLFTGVISQQNSRIAQVLGITPEDIKRVDELGTKYEFLKSKFAPIAEASKQAAQGFTILASNALDAFQLILAASSQPLFDELKAGLKEVQAAISTTTKDAVVFDPGVLAAFKGLFEGLAQGVRGIRAAFAQIDISGFAGTLSTIGQALGLVATAVSKAFVLFFNIASPTINILGGILATFSKIVAAIKTGTGVLGDFSGGVLLSVAKAGALFLTFTKINRTLRSLYGSLLKILGVQLALDAAGGASLLSLTNLKGAFAGLFNLVTRLATPLVVIVGSIAAIDGLLAAFGSDFRITGLLTGLFEGVSNGFDGLINKITGVRDELQKPVKNPFGLVSSDFRDLKADLTQLVEDSKKSLAELKTSLASTSAGIGLPGPIASQAALRIDQLGELFNSDKIKEATRNVESLRRQADKLQSDLILRRKEFAQAEENLLRAQFDFPAAQLRDKQRELQAVQDQISRVQGSSQLSDAEALVPLRAAEQRLSQEVFALQERYNKSQQKSLELAQNRTFAEGQLKTALEGAKDLQDRINEAIDETNRKVAVEFSKIAKPDIRETDLRNIDFSVAVKETANAVNELRGLSREQVEVASKRTELESQALRAKVQEVELERGLASLREQVAKFDSQKSDEAKEAANLGRQQLFSREAELKLVQQVNQQQKNRIQLELEIARLREKGSINQGIEFGLQQFAQDNASIFNVGERFGQSLANGVSEFAGDAIGEAVVAAVDPNRNFKLREAAGNLFLSLGTGLLTDVIKTLFSKLLVELGVNLTSSLTAGAAAATEITTASGTLVAASTEVGTVFGAATLSMSSTISAAAAEAIGAISAARGAQAAASVGGAVGAGLAKGGAVDRMQRIRLPNVSTTHRNAPGYARGGRPSGIDPRDTIPAWLRPGEWVIRPEAVRMYGDRIFDLLNSRKLNPAALKGISGSSTRRRLPIVKHGFATGGPVASSSPRGGGGSVQQILQFHDEQTMDRALAAGPESMIRFARSRRGSYRAALGLEAGI